MSTQHSPPPPTNPRRGPRDDLATRHQSRRTSLPAHLYSSETVTHSETRERSRDRATLYARPTSLAHPPPIRFPPANPPQDTAIISTTAPSTLAPSDVHLHPGAGTPRRVCTSPRPKLVERPCSTVYTTFPIRPPRTPGDGPGDDAANGGRDWRKWLSWVPATRESTSESDLERAAINKPTFSLEASHTDSETACVRHRDGLPKLSRACLVAEIKCYGKVSAGDCPPTTEKLTLRVNTVHAATDFNLLSPDAISGFEHVPYGSESSARRAVNMQTVDNFLGKSFPPMATHTLHTLRHITTLCYHLFCLCCLCRIFVPTPCIIMFFR